MHIHKKNLEIELPFDPVTALLGIYPKYPKTKGRKDIYNPMFLAILESTMTQIWKQNNVQGEDWIQKLL